MALFENYESRIDHINEVLQSHGIESLEAAYELCKSYDIDPLEEVKAVQTICFEDACWAYVAGCAIALKHDAKEAYKAAEYIGEGLQAFCIFGSVADNRKVGIGHGNLASMLLSEDTECFAFLAGHESFAAAEGAIGIALSANKVRKNPLRVILNGLGKDAAEIISRINGFTYVKTEYDQDLINNINNTRIHFEKFIMDYYGLTENDLYLTTLRANLVLSSNEEFSYELDNEKYKDKLESLMIRFPLMSAIYEGNTNSPMTYQYIYSLNNIDYKSH